MLGSSTFWTGVIVGVGGTWVYHRYMRPMSTKKA